MIDDRVKRNPEKGIRVEQPTFDQLHDPEQRTLNQPDLIVRRLDLHLVANRQLIHRRSVGAGFHGLGNAEAEIVNGNLEERLHAQASLFKPRDFQLVEERPNLFLERQLFDLPFH